ncbi:MAG: alpha/beta hydrolase [Tepidisphaeraceae bacterium]
MTTERRPDAELQLWPEGIPEKIEGVTDTPRLVIYKANRPNAPAVLVCPGGGYQNRAAHEADPVAFWLNSIGITGIVVHYRVKPYKHPQPLNDLSQAMRLTKQHAAEWGIDAEKIGVLGFSAGGHLASTLCTIAEPDVFPALAILLYPVITLGPPSAHTGSRNNLCPDPTDLTWIQALEQRPPRVDEDAADVPLPHRRRRGRARRERTAVRRRPAPARRAVRDAPLRTRPPRRGPGPGRPEPVDLADDVRELASIARVDPVGATPASPEPRL